MECKISMEMSVLFTSTLSLFYFVADALVAYLNKFTTTEKTLLTKVKADNHHTYLLNIQRIRQDVGGEKKGKNKKMVGFPGVFPAIRGNVVFYANEK